MTLPDETCLSVVVYSAPSGSAAEDGLKLLASWCATTGQTRKSASGFEPEALDEAESEPNMG
ncbi:hypothetical protein [Nocardia sp. NPDC005998]|uniref:hypothetical protein n=1 Tax=Nocardia sp. NPDC005998 TaxID=3156894 RepID=UPI0033B4B349